MLFRHIFFFSFFLQDICLRLQFLIKMYTYRSYDFAVVIKFVASFMLLPKALFCGLLSFNFSAKKREKNLNWVRTFAVASSIIWRNKIEFKIIFPIQSSSTVNSKESPQRFEMLCKINNVIAMRHQMCFLKHTQWIRLSSTPHLEWKKGINSLCWRSCTQKDSWRRNKILKNSSLRHQRRKKIHNL